MHLAYYPAFRFCLIWIFGIVYHHYFFQEGFYIIGSCIFLLGLTLWLFLSCSKGFNTVIYVLLFFLSILNADLNSSISEYPVLGEKLYQIEVNEYYEVNDSIRRIYGTAQIIDSDHSENRSFKFYSILSSSQLPEYKSLLSNSSFLISGEARQISQGLNPSSFSFYDYFKKRNIEARLVLKMPNVFVQQEEAKSSLELVQNYFKESILDWQIPKQAKSVYLAIILGDKSLLSSTTKERFKSSSLMHVLVVSGMHLGLLFLIIQFIFSRTSLRNSLLKPILIIIILWSFTAISGFGIASIRAAIMLSLMTLGEWFKRPNNSINNLLASALIILIIWPNELFELGFQLSFLAVLSLVLTYPSIHKFMHSRFVIIEFILSGIKMAICVHILLWPVLIYHFGSLNFIFLLSSLASVFLIPLMMYLGILYLLIGTIYDFHFIDICLEYLYIFLNQSLVWFESLSFFKLSYTFHTFNEFAFAIGIFFSLALYLKYRTLVLLSIGTLFLMSFNFNSVYSQNESNKNEVWIYAFQDKLVFASWIGHEFNAITDSSSMQKGIRLIQNHKMNAVGNMNCYDCLSQSLESREYKGLLSLSENTLQIINKKQPKLTVEYWFVGSRVYPSNTKKKPSKGLILNSWASEYQLSIWEEWSKKNKVKLYSLKEGALRLV